MPNTLKSTAHQRRILGGRHPQFQPDGGYVVKRETLTNENKDEDRLTTSM